MTCFNAQVCCERSTDAGYRELGFSVLQALLELHLYQLRHGSTDEATVLADFAQWWDDEHPRIGSSGYLGFPAPSRGSPCPSVTEPKKDNSLSRLDQWLVTELNEGQRLVPRSIEDVGGDPFSYVLAADMKGLLFLPAWDAAPASLKILDVLLAYMGLPRHWTEQVLLLGEPAARKESNTASSCAFPLLVPPHSSMLADTNELHRTLFHTRVTPSSLFPRSLNDPRGRWFTALNPVTANTSQMAVRLLEQATRVMGGVPAAAAVVAQASLAVASENPALYVR